jgi:hypothetical protein
MQAAMKPKAAMSGFSSFVMSRLVQPGGDDE